MRLGWVIEGLRTGIVTTRYPAQPDVAATRGARTHPLLDATRCEAGAGCNECVRACLPDALALEHTARQDDFNAQQATATTTFWLDLGRCIGCGLCAEVCPQHAITMTNAGELAARSRDALLLAAPIGGGTQRSLHDGDANGRRRDDNGKTPQ